jgi:hypothetical protein
MSKEEWISVKEAAAIVGYSPNYFRDVFCRTDRPLVVIRVKPYLGGRRRILVSSKSVLDLVKSETLGPR